MPRLYAVCFLIVFYIPICMAVPACGGSGIGLQILGSGGPEITDRRASSGYLIWQHAKARVLVDIGGGSMLRFEQSGARFEDLDVILLSHLHVDHSADLPYLIKASFFTGRDRDLPLYGPTGSDSMPSTREFINILFGEKGAYRYLSDFVNGPAPYHLVAHDVNARNTGKSGAKRFTKNLADIQISAVPVHHGPIPALAWRVVIGNRDIVFSGDMNNDYHNLALQAENADLLVAHNAIPEQATGVARNLHMPPSVIGQIAARAGVKTLVLSHRMQRTLGNEQQTMEFIRKSYNGPVHFAEDLQCFSLQ